MTCPENTFEIITDAEDIILETDESFQIIQVSEMVINPSGDITKEDIGLGNVDNTSDLDKPISTAQAAALADKQPLDSDLTEIAALTTQPFGRELLTLSSASELYSAASLGTVVTYDFMDFEPAGAASAALATALAADITDHSGLTGVGTNTHADIDTALARLVDTLGVNTGDQTIELTGDVTGSGTASFPTTLAAVNSNTGSFGSGTQSASFTVNAKGLVTAASQTTITPVVNSITGLGTGVASALGVNIGVTGSPVVNGGDLGTPSSGVATNLTGTAAGLTAGNVTTNANLTGDVTSVGNATTIGALKVTNGMLAGSIANAKLVNSSVIINGNAVSLGGSTTVTAVNPNALTISSPLSGTSYNGSNAVSIGLSSGYGDTQNPYSSKPANNFLVSPNGIAGVPSFRTIVPSDIPQLNQNTTGSAATLTTTRSIWGQNFNGSVGIAGAMTGVSAITGGAGNMTITSGTGASRLLFLRTTTAGGVATTAMSIGETQAINLPQLTASTQLRLNASKDIVSSPGGMELIESKTIAVNTTTVSFASIPAGFKALKMFGTGRSTRSAAMGAFMMRFNNDAAANYTDQTSRAVNATWGGGPNLSNSSIIFADVPAALKSSEIIGSFELIIQNYESTTQNKSLISNFTSVHNTAADCYTGHWAGTWRTTNAVTSIQIVELFGAQVAAGTIISLYGIY